MALAVPDCKLFPETLTQVLAAFSKQNPLFPDLISDCFYSPFVFRLSKNAWIGAKNNRETKKRNL